MEIRPAGAHVLAYLRSGYVLSTRRSCASSYRVHVHAIDATSSANRFFLGLGLGGVHLARPAGDELLEPLPCRLRRPPLAVDLDAVDLVGLDEAPII